MLPGLFAGEFAVLAADGEVVLVFGLGGLQIGLYARDGGVKVLLGEFAFPDSDDGPGEGVEALGFALFFTMEFPAREFPPVLPWAIAPLGSKNPVSVADNSGNNFY